MYGRKGLETFYKTSCVEDSEFYHKDAADKVMDAMEARIKELESAYERLVIGNMKLTNDKASYKSQLEELRNANERIKRME